MTPESSRKLDPAPALTAGPCPRCGRRLEGEYKYCPHCAYRLRPEIVPMAPQPVPRPSVAQRLVALGGYLAFASMLLLVVYAGFRLFAAPTLPERPVSKVILTRDSGCPPLTRASLRRVEAGEAFWGYYGPGEEFGTGRPATTELDLSHLAAFARALEVLRDQKALAGALEVLRDPQASAGKLERARRTVEALEKARQTVEQALGDYADLEEAIASWADARANPAPATPQTGIPDAYNVDDPFEMSVHEVTNDQYFEFLLAWARKGGRAVPNRLLPSHWQRRTGNPGVPRIYDQYRGDYPVRGIPFDAALEFCGWFWEARLDADPDLVVDLPTWREYVLAARGDNFDFNYPWGYLADEARNVNLESGGPWPVRRDPENDFNGFGDLVGNVREWVYYIPDERAAPSPTWAAGWSYEHGRIGERETPFSPDGFRPVRMSSELRDVGFRIVIRQAPALPVLVRVTAGPVRYGPAPRGLLPPEQFFADVISPDEGPTPREHRIAFPQDTGRVDRDFEIAATEITNRQYLAFLAAMARDRSWEGLKPLIPGTWKRVNRLERTVGPEERPRQVFRAFYGYYLPPEKLKRLFTPGYENHPVQAVTLQQALAYTRWLGNRLGRRCALPTVAQFLRAGRGDGGQPYPWGDDEANVELVSVDRPDQEYPPRSFSLRGRLGAPPDRILGLAGNLAEFVRDEQENRILLAGGFYELPASLCTLDSFMDANWSGVQYEYPVTDEDGFAVTDDKGRPVFGVSDSFTVPYFTGFRVVRLPERF